MPHPFESGPRHGTDRQHVHRAMSIAVGNARAGKQPFGAVIVKGRSVVAEAANQIADTGDPSAHAEIEALRALAGGGSACAMYSSCEPCVMCLGAIARSGISRVVFGATREEAAAWGFGDAVPAEKLRQLAVDAGVELTVCPVADAEEPFRRFRAGRSATVAGAALPAVGPLLHAP